MSSTAPISYEHAADRERLYGSGNWSVDNGTHPVLSSAVPPSRRSLLHWAQVAFLAAASSMTSGPDPWSEPQRRARITVASMFRTSNRRRITPREARRMALDLLYRAEAERAAAAQAEAERGIAWEDVS